MRPFLVSLGLVSAALIGVGLTRLIVARPPVPGKLVARVASLEWRGETREDAQARFEVVNTGGTRVVIRSVSSSCNCAEPVVEPTTIPPGGVATVEVKATPPPRGNRSVTFTVITDSLITPVVELSLKMIGTRRAPYLAGVDGELGYPEDDPTGVVRELTVYMVELPESDRMPAPRSDLPFLKVEPLGRSESPIIGTGDVNRLYKFRVIMASRPPLGTFTGEVAVVDPWDDEHSERALVHGRVVPALRMAPSRVSVAADDPSATADIKLISQQPMGPVTLKWDGETPMTAERSGGDTEASPTIVTLRPKQGMPMRPGEYTLIVQLSVGEPIRVPVLACERLSP